MTATLQIDQVSLPAGQPNRARSDGILTGALVTLTSIGSGTTHEFSLLWVPIGDTTASASLAVTGNPRVWTFSPLANKPGTYRILLIEDKGLATETRVVHTLSMRTPIRGLRVPALNEVADPSSSLLKNGAAQVAASEDNEFTAGPAGSVGTFDYAGWFRSVHQLFLVVEAITGGGSGDVVGPASAVDNAIVRFDGTTGKLIQSSLATLSDTGIATVVGLISSQAVGDGTAIVTLTNAGTNPGTCVIRGGNRTPQNNVTGFIGDLYVRSQGISSRLYQLRSATELGPQSSPWVEFGDAIGAGFSTDDAIVRFAGTTGKILKYSTPASLDDAGIGTFAGVIATQGISDSTPVFTGTNTGSNPGSFRIFTGDRSPEALVSANAGDFYASDNGIASKLYQLRSSGDGANTPWTELGGREVNAELSTGLYTGGDLTVNGGTPSTFDISAGSGWVADNFTAEPSVTRVAWSAFTSVTVTALATQSATWIGIDSTGAIVQQSTAWSSTQRKDVIGLGVAMHLNHATIGAIVRAQQVAYSPGAETLTFFDLFGPSNRTGNAYTAVGANLFIQKSAGTTWLPGSNYSNSREAPSITTDAAIGSAGFALSHINPGDPTGFTFITGLTAINPDQWDNGSGTLQTVPNNKFTVQWIFFLASGPFTVVCPGQALYDSAALAIAGISDLPFSYSPLLELSTLCTRLIVKKGTTALNGVDATFRQAGRFGLQFTGGGGGSSSGSGGDVVGPASAIDNAFCRFDTTSGKLIQSSTAATLDDTGIATFLGVIATQATSDSTPVFTGTNTGTNPGSYRVLTGNRSPEGVVTANSADLYVRDGGVNSKLYQLRSAGDGVNTPWTEVGAGSGDVVGPASAIDNAFCRFDTTTGKLIQSSTAATLSDTGIATFLGVIATQATSDSTPVFTGTNTGTNAGSYRVFAGNRSPESVVSANAGDMYVRDSGVTSRVYQLRSAGDGVNTPWAEVGSGDVVGPASALDNAFCRFDTTSGKLIQSSTAASLDDTGVATFLGVIATQATSDTTATFTATNTGTNAGSSRKLVGNRAPEAAVIANSGDIYIRDSGTSSRIYQLRSAGDGVLTPWVELGDLVGPASAVDNAISRFDLTTGKILQSSAAIIDDSGRLSAKTFNFLALTARGSSTAAITIDWTDSYHQSVTLTAATVTFTFTAPPGVTGGLTLYVKQDATGGRLAVWPGTVKWSNNGIAPTLTSTANALDIITFLWDGTNYFGFFNAKFA